MAKVGAKGKYDEKVADLLNLLSLGYSNHMACEKAGIAQDTFYRWINEKSEFSDMVKRARKEGERKSIADVEAALLDIAKGFEYEEVRTEYESKLNPATNKYEPTIKKQVRTKKRVVPTTEAIKFYLSNKAPEVWKNRLEQTNLGQLDTNLRLVHVTSEGGRKPFPSSEDEVDVER